MSFTHLYNQDRTKRAFKYEGEHEDQEQQNRQEENFNKNREGDQDYGYGGYKKGHTDVMNNWQQNTSNSMYNQKPSKGADLWEDVKQAKESIQGLNSGFNVRNRPYDDVLAYPSEKERQKEEV